MLKTKTFEENELSADELLDKWLRRTKRTADDIVSMAVAYKGLLQLKTITIIYKV